MLTNTEHDLRAGDVIARARAKAYSTRNVHQAKDDVDAALERLMAEAQNGEPTPLPSKPTHKIKPFDLDNVHESVVAAHTACKAWLQAASVHRKPYTLTMCGRSGCGKTHMMRNAYRVILGNTQKIARMWTWSALLSALKVEDAGFIMYTLGEVDFVFIDDIGAENISGDFTRGLSCAVLCDLLDRREGKWTMFSSNLTLSEIAKTYDARIASRLIRNGGVICDMTDAEDYALREWRARNNK